MHPYLTHQNYLSPSMPYARAHRKCAEMGGGLLRRWLRAVVRNWKRRKMIAALQALDDRLLKDIGIYRTDIPRIVAGFDDRELGMVPVAANGQSPKKGNHDAHLRAA